MFGDLKSVCRVKERYDIFNICQRGIGNPNPVKLGRCIKELKRISLPAYNKRKIEKTICKNNLPFVFVLT